MVSEPAKFQAGVCAGVMAYYCRWYPAANGQKQSFGDNRIRSKPSHNGPHNLARNKRIDLAMTVTNMDITRMSCRNTTIGSVTLVTPTRAEEIPMSSKARQPSVSHD